MVWPAITGVPLAGVDPRTAAVANTNGAPSPGTGSPPMFRQALPDASVIPADRMLVQTTPGWSGRASATRTWRLPLASATVNGVPTPALFVVTMLLVTVTGLSASSKSNTTASGQSDWRAAPLVGLTETNCGGRVSGSRNVRVNKVAFVAASVARTVAVIAAPSVGAPAREKLKALVSGVFGELTTASVCVAVTAPLRTTSSK